MIPFSTNMGGNHDISGSDVVSYAQIIFKQFKKKPYRVSCFVCVPFLDTIAKYIWEDMMMSSPQTNK